MANKSLSLAQKGWLLLKESILFLGTIGIGSGSGVLNCSIASSAHSKVKDIKLDYGFLCQF